MTLSARIVLLPGALLAACAATTPSGQPHDMSAVAHGEAARDHTQAAKEHAAAHRPDAAIERARCTAGRARPGPNGAAIEEICWSSVENPTDAHRAMAEEHERQAADHRAASGALRDAETRTCAGIAPADRDMSPFERREDIVAVNALRRNEFYARTKMPPEMLRGAVVTFRAVPGLTAEWLQRVVSCHVARNAALGHVVPEMPDCPLVPMAVDARVSTAGDGFTIAVSSNNPKTAREILSRAERLRGVQTTRKDDVR